jgi:hypothetical protein
VISSFNTGAAGRLRMTGRAASMLVFAAIFHVSLNAVSPSLLPKMGASLYKHFYPEGQEETWRDQQGNRKRCGGKQAWQELDGRSIGGMQHFSRPIPARPVFRERPRGWHRRSDTLRPNKRPIGQPDICRRFDICLFGKAHWRGEKPLDSSL